MTRQHLSRRCLVRGIALGAGGIILLMIIASCFSRVVGETPEF